MVPTLRKPLRLASLIFSLLTAVALLAGCRAPEQEKPAVVVFAAASLRDVVQAIGAVFARTHQAEVVYNFAGSNTLALQLHASPEADVFLSANPDWVDVLEKAEITIPQSRRNFLSNRLVIVSRTDADFRLSTPRGLASLPFSFLVLADPEAVPVGRYAKTFLQAVELTGHSLWEAVRDKIAPTADVRAALGLVESDPRIIGIVYRTDAASSAKVRVLAEVPPHLHQPIIYCAVAIHHRPRPELAEQFLDFLHSAEAVALYETHGFVVGERRPQEGC